MIILLDHNYTLVSNSHQRRSPFTRQIDIETYRDWLLDLLRDRRVILITARPEKYREPTLASIRAKTGWQPEAAYFNEAGLMPPLAKKRALERHIFPRFGGPGQTVYFGVESNPKTRAMYDRFAIPSVTAAELEQDPGRLDDPALQTPRPQNLMDFCGGSG